MLQPERPTAGLELGAETVVVCAYGLLIPDELLGERSWLNVHPSLLPRWRGAAPVERAIMAGDERTGVTIHETVHELDAGPVAGGSGVPDRTRRRRRRGLRASGRSGRRACSTTFWPTRAEIHAAGRRARRTPRRSRPPTASSISTDPEYAVRVVRALSPHIGARAVLHDRPVTVWSAPLVETVRSCRSMVQPDGRRRMAYDDWVRGLR